MLILKSRRVVSATTKQVLAEKGSKIGSQVIYRRKIKKYLLEI